VGGDCAEARVLVANRHRNKARMRYMFESSMHRILKARTRERMHGSFEVEFAHWPAGKSASELSY